MDTILVVVEQREGKLNRVSWETLTGAQAIAAQTGWTVEAAVVGNNIGAIAGEVAAKKVAKVYAIESEKLARYTPDGFAAALKEFIRQRQPKLVLMPHTYQVRDFAPKLATSLGVVPGSRLHRLQVRKRQAAAGAADVPGQVHRRRRASPAAVRGSPASRPERFAPTRCRRARRPLRLKPWRPQIADGVIRTRPEEPFKEAKQAVDLTQAEIIVSVGRGIKEQKNLEMAQKLADALGGEIAASRPICDNGWLPMERQVGSSGQTVAPKLYLALGISGAIQHIVGMKGARTIIAINKDSEAPIFEVSDIGVVGNLFEIVPPLIEEVKKAKAVSLIVLR